MQRRWKFTGWLGLLAALSCSTAVAQWQTAQLLNATSEANADCKNPKVVGSKNGGFHACWASNASQVRYRRYTSSLQTPVTAASVFHFNPYLAESLSGHVHIVYEHWASDAPEVGWVQSTNGGASFSAHTEISSSSRKAKFPLIAPFGTGTSNDIIMSYWNTSNKDLRFRRWNGSSWAADAYVGSDGGSEYEVFGIARSPVDGSVWRSFDNGDYVAVRKYNGSSWESPINLYNQGFFARQRVAVNDAGQVMVMWDMSFQDNNYYSIVYTPGQGVGTRQVVSSQATWGTALTAIPGTNDFYTVYAKDGASRIVGRRWSNGTWGSEELVSVGLANDFTPNPDVSADPNGSGALYAVWEYWASGRPQVYCSVKPGVAAPPYRASLVSVNAPSTMAPGATATVTVTYNNTGTQSWNNTSTRMGTSNPRDRSSAFYNSADWIGANRPTVCDQASVAPGNNGTFTFIAKAPTSPGQYNEKFELVQEGVTWFDDTGDDWTWNVTVSNPLPAHDSVTLNTTNLVADGSTNYTVTYKASDVSGVSDIRDMRVMFDMDTGTPSNSRGYLAWGQAQSDIILFGGSWTINSATGGGYWAFENASWGYQYITPVSASTSTSGNQRTVTWTFKVNPAWGSAGPASGNYISVWVRDTSGYPGWADSDTLWGYAFNVSQPPGAISGTVTNSSGAALSGATVSTNTGGYSTTTNASGQYTLSNVVPGTYNVTASKSGYINQTQNNVSVTAGQTTANINFSLAPDAPAEVLNNGNMEGGWWATGWGGGSVLPNDWDGWYNPGNFNCFQETSIKHGGSNSARTTISSGGDGGSGGYKRSMFQNVYVGSNATFTLTVWARHNNGNCPSIMCWNPEAGSANPHDAYLGGRYQWVTTDNWGQLNTWVSRSMNGTAPSSGWITVMTGGAHHGGGGTGTVYIDDVSVVTP